MGNQTVGPDLAPHHGWLNSWALFGTIILVIQVSGLIVQSFRSLLRARQIYSSPARVDEAPKLASTPGSQLIWYIVFCGMVWYSIV